MLNWILRISRIAPPRTYRAPARPPCLEYEVGSPETMWDHEGEPVFCVIIAMRGGFITMRRQLLWYGGIGSLRGVEFDSTEPPHARTPSRWL